MKNSNNNRDECINVVVRIRGKANEETGKCSLLNILDDKSIQVENKTFYYDYVANMNSTQEELFQKINEAKVEFPEDIEVNDKIKILLKKIFVVFPTQRPSLQEILNEILLLIN